MHPGPHASPAPASAPLSERELEELDQLLERLPAPLQPLDVTALDGYLCGVLLQPAAVPAPAWLAGVFDVDGRSPPPGGAATRIAQFAARRHAELDAAIAARAWFDPWVYELDDPGLSPVASVLPWVAGFASAMDRFPALLALPDPDLVEPLAVLYAAFDPQDLEDAQELLAVIETLEPPATLAEAVEDLVRSVLLIADVSRPVAGPGGAGGKRDSSGESGSRRPGQQRQGAPSRPSQSPGRPRQPRQSRRP